MQMQMQVRAFTTCVWRRSGLLVRGRRVKRGGIRYQGPASGNIQSCLARYLEYTPHCGSCRDVSAYCGECYINNGLMSMVDGALFHASPCTLLCLMSAVLLRHFGEVPEGERVGTPPPLSLSRPPCPPCYSGYVCRLCM